MSGAISRRFAIVAAADFQEALRTARSVAGSIPDPPQTLILGQERRFISSTTAAPPFAPGVFDRTTDLRSDSPRIMSLTFGSATAPAVVAATAKDFGTDLQRQLFTKHARRLSRALDEGGFPVLFELRSVTEERSTTRVLLQSGDSAVDVHDLNLFSSARKQS